MQRGAVVRDRIYISKEEFYGGTAIELTEAELKHFHFGSNDVASFVDELEPTIRLYAKNGFRKPRDVSRLLNKESTEPLSQERIAADLLLSLLRILKLDMTREDIAEVYKAMQAYSLYKSGTKFHDLAIMGQAAQQGRSQGPNARRAKTQEVRKLIWQAAQTYWSKHPNYAGRRQSTAEAIAAQVNAEILRRSLTSKPLTAKAISEHIAAGLKTGNLSR
jgi:hypothetical protein